MREAETAHDVQYIRNRVDLGRIAFVDGVAAVEVPVELLAHIRFKNADRQPSPRLDAVARSIRDRGFIPTDPIIARIGQKGRWIIVDGGHRLTAARAVSAEFWSNLLQKKVRTLYFLLFETERSWSKCRDRAQRGRTGGKAKAKSAGAAPVGER
ncbi:MAG: ParB/RepB/Spo0J family partition protein [Pseudomonadota bacterium]